MIAIKIRKKLEENKFKGKLSWHVSYHLLLIKIRLAAFQRCDELMIDSYGNSNKIEYIKYKLKKEGFTVTDSIWHMFIKW